ncbi:UDP-N-acetylglucosamine 1-carboxyvinyltransferase [Candidatus Entotheonella palauensis]|nr:UDP-N-acetylglucosamine 1-carboxyvinyltransferase [Candidatus Entotheonella palauensis]
MEYFWVEGGHRLGGSITPIGNKNAALPLLAACLLTDETLHLHNVPDIGDVRTKLALLSKMGVVVQEGQSGQCSLTALGVGEQQPDVELSRQIRTATLLAGPLLARRGHVVISRPGGDRIGRRRLDTHLLALQALGTDIEVRPDYFELRTDGLRGCDIFLDEMSVTGTEQAIFASVLAEGTTALANVAMEPHVQEVCHCLNAMGAKIEGIGTHNLTIEGVTGLHGATHRIGPDYMEVGSLIGLAAATRSALRIEQARPDQHRMTRIMFGRLGVTWEVEGDDIVVPPDQPLEVQTDFDGAVPKIDDMPWPGFPPDLISIALVVATQARGTVLIHQKMFDQRLVFADRLIDMGAGIVLCDPHRAVVMGPSRLRGQNLVSPDIRAGMALVIAALTAEGVSTIHNIIQIDRGYEQLERRLQGLGAHIERLGE